jgi:hypothetical protein
MSQQRGLDGDAAEASRTAAGPTAASPIVALGRLEGEAARDAAATLRAIAIRLPGGSRLRAEMLESVVEYATLARSRGVRVPSAARSGRSRRR